MNPVFRNIFLLIVFSPVLLMGQDLNYKVLNLIHPFSGQDWRELESLNDKFSYGFNNPQSIGDLNNDGISEILFGDIYLDSLYLIYLNNKLEVEDVKHIDIRYIYKNSIGVEYLTPSSYNGPPVKSEKIFIKIGDLDNDGISEIAIGNPYHKNGEVCILFFDNDGEVKDYNIIEPYNGNNSFYSESRPANHFGINLCSLGDINQDDIPDILITGLSDRYCDSLIYDTLDNGYVEWKCYNPENDDYASEVMYIVKLNSDGSVKEHHSIKPDLTSYFIQNGDTIPYKRGPAKLMDICNIGDIDGNGVNDLILSGIGHFSYRDHPAQTAFYVILLNEDYSIKSEEFKFFSFKKTPFGYPSRGRLSSFCDVNMDGVLEFSYGDGDGSFVIGYLDSLGDLFKIDTSDIDLFFDLVADGSFNNFVNSGDLNGDGFPNIFAVEEVYNPVYGNSSFTVLNPSEYDTSWVQGANLTLDRNGIENQAYLFNGTTDNISIEHKSYLKPNFPFSISLWFKIDQFGDTSSVLYASNEKSNIYSGFWIDYLPDGKVTAGYGDGQGHSDENRMSKVSSSVLDTTSWHNVVAVFNGLDDIEIYIDFQRDSGTYIGSGSNMSRGTQKSIIGGSLGHSSGSFHKGKIGQITIFDTSISSNQVEFCSSSSFNFAISIISIYPDSCLDSECVWPGDANFDGIVNSKDIIQIGSVFSQTSDKKRTMATTGWVEQTCEDWNLNQFNVNAKHSDSDGNGVVNFLDASIVEKNYSKVSFKMDGTVPVDPFGPPLYIISNRDTVSNQDSIVYSISLGDSATPAENVYGVSMTLKHETEEVFGSINSASFMGSWLGTKNVDMIATGFPLDDGIDIGMARTDQTNRTGQGYLSTVKVIIPDNLGEMVNNFDLRLTDLLIKSYEGDTIVPNVIYGDPVFILNRKELDFNLLEKGLKVYPNPNSGVFNIDSKLQLDKIRIMDLSGRLMHALFTPSQHEVLNLSGFEKGVYLIEFQSGDLTAHERVFVK